MFRVILRVEPRSTRASLHVMFRLAHANRPHREGRILLVGVYLLRSVAEGEVITFGNILTVLVDELLQTL